MSRLDDELKVAFQRREPSADFAARVLARLDEAPIALAPPSFWQRLTAWFAVPQWRLATAGAMALLLVALGFIVLRAQRATGVDQITPALTAAAGHAASRTSDEKDGLRTTVAPNAPVNLTVATRRAPAHHHSAVVAKHAQPSAEAEAAKEKVLFALQITNDALNDVQRAISDDHSTNERPEPVQNR